MTSRRIKFLIGAVLVGTTLTLSVATQAYWGSPRGGPWSGPGSPDRGYGRAFDRTHERQSQMRDHGAAMRTLGRMLSGQRTFNRAEAVGLARAIEASAGENLARLFKPAGNWRSNPLSRARIGDDLDIFKSHAIALQVAAGELADQLEKRPGAEDIRSGRAWSPDWGRSGRYRSSRWRNEDAMLNRDVFNAFGNLQTICSGCHTNFRTAWR